MTIAHGVGPMRQYALGAILLGIDDSGLVLGHLPEPLLVPSEAERDGHVPHVVYSCGSLIHDGRLVIDYGASDTSTTFATVEVDAILAALTRAREHPRASTWKVSFVPGEFRASRGTVDPGAKGENRVPTTSPRHAHRARPRCLDGSHTGAPGIRRRLHRVSDDRYCGGIRRYVTRGQMAAFLVRALGYTDDGGGDLYTDDDDSVFQGDIDRLGTAGVTKGCNPPVNDMFCPDKYVTRGQMAAFLVRALGYTDDGGGDLYTDDDDSVFQGDIDRLGTAGVTKGCNPPGNTMFCPDKYVTRGQMAAFLRRALAD